MELRENLFDNQFYYLKVYNPSPTLGSHGLSFNKCYCPWEDSFLVGVPNLFILLVVGIPIWEPYSLLGTPYLHAASSIQGSRKGTNGGPIGTPRDSKKGSRRDPYGFQNRIDRDPWGSQKKILRYLKCIPRVS